MIMKSPASPALSQGNSSSSHTQGPGLRLIGSVKSEKSSVLRPRNQMSTSPAKSSVNAPRLKSSYQLGSQHMDMKHRVYQAFQRDKLLMGAEREISQLNVIFVMLLVTVGAMTFNWHFLLLAVIYGWPVQRALRMFAEIDPDYWKVYLDALGTPHIRVPMP